MPLTGRKCRSRQRSAEEHELVFEGRHYGQAPDIDGVDSDFILVVRSKEEPDLFAYALSYDWPGSNFGYEGVYFWVDGEFVQVN